MEKKRSKGVIVFGIIFILMMFNMGWHYRTFKSPPSKVETRAEINETLKEADFQLSEEQIQKLVDKKASFTHYGIRRSLWLVLLGLYLICGLGILLGKDVYYSLIMSTLIVRIVNNIMYFISYYDSYRYPFIVISNTHFPTPKMDSEMAADFFVWSMGILFSIIAIYFFTRPKVKEQFK